MSLHAAINRLPHPITLLLAVWVVLYGPLLFTDGTTVISSRSGDIASAYLDWALFTDAAAQDGEWLPTWSPHIFSGVPFVGTTATQAHYLPSRMLLAMFGAARAINIDVALHVLLLALSAAWFLLRLGRSPLSATLGGITLMLAMPTSGRVLAGHITVVDCAAWTGLALSCAHALGHAREARTRYSAALALAFVLAMQSTSGHPQTFAMSLAMTLCVGSAALVAHRAQRPFATQIVTFALATAAVTAAILVAAPALVLARAALAESFRNIDVSPDAALAFVMRYAVSPENLLTLLHPQLLGGVDMPQGQLRYFGAWLFWENSVFVGVITLALCAAGIAAAWMRDRRTTIALLGMAVVLVLLSLGPDTPLLPTLVRAVPALGIMRAPNRLWFVITWIVVVFATQGVDAVRASVPSLRAARTASLALLALGTVLWLVNRSDAGPQLWLDIFALDRDDAGRVLHHPAAFAASAQAHVSGILRVPLVTAALAALVLWWRGGAWAAPGLVLLSTLELTWVGAALQRHFDVKDTDPPAFAAIAATAHSEDVRVCVGPFPNAAMRHNVFNTNGYDPAFPGRMYRVLGLNGCRQSDAKLELLRTGYTQEGDTLRPLPAPLPHASIITQARAVTDAEAFAWVERADFDPHGVVPITTDNNTLPFVRAPGEGERISIERQSNAALHFSTTLVAPALVLITDAYSNDLTATTDQGERLELMPAFGVVTAVHVPSGPHHITLRYEPKGLIAAKNVAIIVLVGWLLLALVWFLRRNASQGDS